MSSVLANHLPSTAYTRQHDDGDIKSGLTMHGTNCISSQSAPSPLRSRWSKRAGLHVVHCSPRVRVCPPQPIRLPPSARPSVTRGGEENVKRLVETDGLAHGRLDMQRLDVLPVLLKERDEEVDA